ncbi:MAG: hypothetical protein ACERKY_12115, partial [Anaerolineales bacterium]
LVISIGLLGLALVLVGIGWRYVGSRSPEKGEEPVAEQDTSRNKETLLHAIAALDDVFEAGEISEKEYMKQRSELKDELSGLMTNEHD